MSLKAQIKKKTSERRFWREEEFQSQLETEQLSLLNFSQEKGASIWLSVLPIAKHGFDLHKGAFRDALSLRYGWHLMNTPQTCSCGSNVSVDHAMICSKGGFPTIRHNEVRDLTANTLSEVCHNVIKEPLLQPVQGEILHLIHNSANREEHARLDISARGFWNRSQLAFFDIRVFYPNAPSNQSTTTSAVYKKHENEKKRKCGQRVHEIERGVSTPLVFSTSGGMSKECTIFYQRLAALTADKQINPMPHYLDGSE